MCARPVQLAYAVDDVERAAATFAATFGAGPFFVRHHPVLATVDARGARGTFHHSSAYGQWGDVQVELVALHDDPPPPGLHHVARFVPSLDEEVARLTASGWPLLFEASSSSGVRFAFCDARPDLGHLLEVYEPVPALVELYAGVAMAADGWDGSSSVRPMEALSTRR